LVAGGEILVGQVYTESNGSFTFGNLHSGLYYVTVEAPGYQPARASVMIDARNSSRNQVNISLEPVGPTPERPGQIIAGSSASYKLNLKANHRPFDAKVLHEFDKGNEKQRMGDWKAASSHYQKALRIDPDFYPALNNMGAIALRRKEPAEAESFFLRSLAVKPDDGEAYINLGHVSYEQGQYQQAIERIEEGLKRSPESSAGHFFLGSAYLRLGDLEKAEKELKAACALERTGMSKAHLQLANVYLRRRDMKTAGAELRDYLQANPSDPQGPAIKKLLASIETNHTN
jgi:Tfp pilus assembly protein PilF